MKISVVIPVYKNKELFLANFVHNYPFLKDWEIIVVDDDSRENLTLDLRKMLKSVKISVNKENIGFAKSVNRGVKMASGEFILLLNSDVRIETIKFDNLINQFKQNKDIFAISFLQEEKGGKKGGKNIISFKRGLVTHDRAAGLSRGLTAWAEGGSCILRKKYFDELGGFDQIYAPFYWEDIDISYRAYKAGWKILFDPGVVVEHHHESTIGKYYSKEFIDKTSFRNQFIFIWKNLEDIDKIFLHLFYLPYHILSALFKKNTQMISGMIGAVRLIKNILKARQIETGYSKISDQEIFKLFE